MRMHRRICFQCSSVICIFMLKNKIKRSLKISSSSTYKCTNLLKKKKKEKKLFFWSNSVWTWYTWCMHPAARLIISPLRHSDVSSFFHVLSFSFSFFPLSPLIRPPYRTVSASVKARDAICPESWRSGSRWGCPDPKGIRPRDFPHSMECDGPGSCVEEEAPSFRSRSSRLAPGLKCRGRRAKSCLPPAQRNNRLSLRDYISLFIISVLFCSVLTS